MCLSHLLWVVVNFSNLIESTASKLANPEPARAQPEQGPGGVVPQSGPLCNRHGARGATRCGLGGAQGEVSEDLCEPNEPEVHQQQLEFRKLINESNNILSFIV